MTVDFSAVIVERKEMFLGYNMDVKSAAYSGLY